MKKTIKGILKEIGRALILVVILVPLISIMVPDIIHKMYHIGDPFLGYLESVSVEVVDFRKSSDRAVVDMRIKNQSDSGISFFTFEIELLDENDHFIGDLRMETEGYLNVLNEERTTIDFERPWYIDNWEEVKGCQVKIVDIRGYGPRKKK